MVPSLSFVPLATPTGMIFNPTTVFVISTDGRSAPVVGLWPGGRSRRRDHGDQGRSQQHHAGLDFESGDCHLSFVLVFHFSAFCFWFLFGLSLLICCLRFGLGWHHAIWYYLLVRKRRTFHASVSQALLVGPSTSRRTLRSFLVAA